MNDSEIFKQNILEFNKQLNPAVITSANLETLAGSAPDAIVMVGMGGSGTPGSILQNILDYAIVPIPVLTWKDGGLPALGGCAKNPLYLFVSFSGNTRETLDSFTKAVSKKALVAVVAGGGILLEYAQNAGLAYATFAQGALHPRQAYGLTLYASLIILKSVFPRLTIPDLSAQIDPRQFASRAEQIAARIVGKTTLVYTTQSLSHLGQIFKISIAESGKSPAFANMIPEVNHNELNILETRPRNLFALLVASEREYSERTAEFELTTQILGEYGVASETLQIPGQTPLHITANAIAAAQWLGYQVALKTGRNPLGLEVVNKIKDLAKQKGL